MLDEMIFSWMMVEWLLFASIDLRNFHLDLESPGSEQRLVEEFSPICHPDQEYVWNGTDTVKL